MFDWLKKEHSMKLSDYFELKRPTYVTLQIIPHSSNRNYDTELLVQTMANMYSLPHDRFKREINENKTFKFTYDLPEKASFMIQITKEDCLFYLIIPKRYKNLFTEKCIEVWKRATVNEVDKIPEIGGEAYELRYAKEDPLSLKVNKKTNNPLSNILNVKDIMGESDEIGILYNFLPLDQRDWKRVYSNTMKRVHSNKLVEKEKFTPQIVVTYIALGLIKFIDVLFSLGSRVTSRSSRKNVNSGKNINPEVAITRVTPNEGVNISKHTIKKEMLSVIGTQIVVSSKSDDKTRQSNNAIAVVESYRAISDDNTLIYSKVNNKKEVKASDYKISGVTVNKTSTAECNNFVQVPGRELLERHDIKTKIEVFENPVPEELREGNVSLGESTCKGKDIKAFLPRDYNNANLALLLLSPQGGGKTTLISNIVKDANNARECNIVIDYIKNCELAESIKNAVRLEDIVEIDLSREENFQAFSFNEVSYSGNSEFEKFEVANMKAEQTLAFIDAANSEGLPLTGKMRRYLSAAANVVYLQNNTSIGDVIKCLQKHKKRVEYIEWTRANISAQGLSYLEDMLDALEELNEVEKEIDKKTKAIISYEVVGTKDTKIEGILDRVNLMQENIYLKYMLHMKDDKNIDFIKIMEEGKTLLIKMPEGKYNNIMVKNILVTFFTSKIILATKLRGALHERPARANIFYDEIYQAPTAERVLCDVLSQLRKFGTKPIISAHYLDQLSQRLKNEIKASGASYMLLQGADKKNFDELKEELMPYELEDLLKLKQFHSLNLIRYSKGYGKFVTKLPKPLEGAL
jgi:hypothetical protein